MFLSNRSSTGFEIGSKAQSGLDFCKKTAKKSKQKVANSKIYEKN